MDVLKDIPGVSELRELTLGAGVSVALLDGLIDLSHPCFEGAHITVQDIYWRGIAPDGDLGLHATGIGSVLVGQPDTSVEGLAPQSSLINIPIGITLDTALSPVEFVRGLELALDSGAPLVHVAACHPSRSGSSYDLVTRAIERLVKAGRLVVAPAGNNKGECWCDPAIQPGVLAVGALNEDGTPWSGTNYGELYRGHGIVTRADDVLCAWEDGTTKRHKGTSAATGVVSGIAALLLSLQHVRGEKIDPLRVRAALIDSATPPPVDADDDQRRWLDGEVNVPGAMRMLFGNDILRDVAPSACTVPSQLPRYRRIYALGTIGYDFTTETQRDYFRQRVSQPYDAAQMAAHLAQTPSDAQQMVWTFCKNDVPVYAIDARGPFGQDVHATFIELLALQARLDEQHIDVVSLPALASGKDVTLLGGLNVPLLSAATLRGLYGWNIPAFIDATFGPFQQALTPDVGAKARLAIQDFLHRVYFDGRNIGATSPDRALNYSATNIYQTTLCCIDAANRGFVLQHVGVDKSPYGRPGSDCWEIVLSFYDPDNGRRSPRQYRFTIDVGDQMPVTIGTLRSWAISPAAIG